MLKLPSLVKTKWLTWLRDPTHLQCRSRLVAEDDMDPELSEYCCLGGLGRTCDVSVDTMLGFGTFTTLHANLIARGTWAPYTYTAVRDVLNQPMPFDITRDVESHLMNMNDDQEKTFAEIADWIEENL